MPIFGSRRATSKPGVSDSTTKAEMPGVALGRVGLREHRVERGDPGVRDEPLRAVEDVLAVVAARLGAHRRRVRARAGLGQRVGAEPLPRGELRQEALLLLVRARRAPGRASRATARPGSARSSRRPSRPPRSRRATAACRSRCRRSAPRRRARTPRARGTARRRPTGTRATRRSPPRAGRSGRARACARGRGSRAARRSARRTARCQVYAELGSPLPTERRRL